MSLHRTIFYELHKRRLLPENNGTLLIAVSGGADSLALLHILYSLRDRLSCALHAATLDHQLRGDTGAADAAFVVQTCQEWGIPVTAGATDVTALAASQRLGIEAAARAARYAFLADTARAVGASHIAVAHHAGDQAETVLMHLLRGAGLHGVSGMAWRSPLPDNPDLTLVRPLLNISRAQIDAYCRQHGLTPRTDATNDDTRYLRNRLRHEVLPVLTSINPQVERALGQLADLASADNAYIDQRLHDDVIAPHVTARDQQRRIPRAVFVTLSVALQRRFVAWAAQQLRPNEEAGYTHILAAVDLARRGRVGRRALLPGGLHLRVEYDDLVIEPADAVHLEPGWMLLTPDTEIDLTAPGTALTPNGWTLEVSANPQDDAQVTLLIPANAHLRLRTRRAGDRFAPLGMGGHTCSLKDWMIDRKIPRVLRDQIPLLIVDDAIAAVIVGDQWTVSESVAVRETVEKGTIIFTKMRRT